MSSHKNYRYSKQIRAHRTEHSGNFNRTPVIVGDTFKFKDYACKVNTVTKNVITFTGRKRDAQKEMILNVESFYDALENRRIVMTRFNGRRVAEK